MTDLAPQLARVKEEAAREGTRMASRFWYCEAKKIEEQVDDLSARWEILLAAMRRVGWPAEIG